MTKQEEIREVIDTYTDDVCLYPDKDCEFYTEFWYCISSDAAYGCLMKRLDELGVVLKVEGELPDTELTNEDYKELDTAIIEDMTETWRIGGRRPTAEYASKRLSVLTARKQNAKIRDILDKADYVKTGPLI